LSEKVTVQEALVVLFECTKELVKRVETLEQRVDYLETMYDPAPVVTNE